ncbi:MAG: hypothetical protein LBB56_07035 [Chitinispirillales bacterium]|jgi:hypothetical protein|nr:hypothetical protein [Chitinispirillales bacterium]
MSVKKNALPAQLTAFALITVLTLTSCANRGGENGLDESENAAVYDLYVMSMCPFGFTAVAELSDMLRAFPRHKLNVWFIGRVEGDKLSSLRGEPEIFDETLWLGINALYPARYREFLSIRGTSKESTEDIIKKMALDFEKIKHWAEFVGRTDLREHYVRALDHNVNASPTLFINDERYAGRIAGGQLVRAKCAGADPAPQFCREYPECSDDSDCYTKGKLGKCVNPGKAGRERAVCEYRDDAAFKLTVLKADSAADSPEAQVVDWFEKALPGAKTHIVKFSSEEGKQLTERYNPQALPFFHFEKSVEDAYRFSSVQERLETAADGGYMLKKGGVRENYFPLRTEKPGLIEVYADPLMPNIGSIIKIILSNPDLARRVVLRPLTAGSQRDQSQPFLLSRLRTEEAQRWITLANDFPAGSYHAYLKSYAYNPGSSYWFNWLNNANINREKFLRKIEANGPAMDSYREETAEIFSGEPVMIMLKNRTKITVSNEGELERLLNMFTGSGPAS